MVDKSGDSISRLIAASRLANPLHEALKPLASYQLSRAIADLSVIKIPTYSSGIEKILAAQNEWANGILGSFQSPTPWLENFLNRIEFGRRFFQNAVPGIALRFDSFFKDWEQLPQRARDSIIAMAEAGWYIDLQMGISNIIRFKRVADEEGAATAEAGMVSHFEERLDAIHASLNERFPHRKRFFDAAFGAIERGEHALAIPVLFMQTDGVCKDVAGQYFFIKVKGKGPGRPGVAPFVLKQVRSDLSQAFLCVFEEVRPIGQSVGQRAPDFNGLNRHTVLHGEDLEYGTKINSLKAVSLLNYVAQILTRKLQDDESDVSEVGEDESRG